jgi:WD40 repeat protein/DNA-binding winged helix-turn-helix (wHTH) protein
VNNGERVIYEFGGFRLDPALRTLLRDGDPVTVWPKVFDTLVLLLKSHGRILEKEELMHALWPESFVEESNLTQNIFVLRKILGDDRNGHSFIQTVPRRGYKFVAPVREAGLLTSESDLPASYWRGRSPFRGLQIFETEDAWLFFGREQETDDLLAHLRRSPILSVVGNSGSGKSSLLRAGLIPALQQGRFCQDGLANEQWRIAVFRPSAAPFDYLAEVLPSQLAPELSLQEKAEFIHQFRSKLSLGGDGLRDAIAALAGAVSYETGPTRILLLVDQFEELFTLTADRRVRDSYIDSLLAAARLDGPVPVHMVLAVRADFYPECLEHAELSRLMAANQYNVGRMSHEQLRETIEKRLQLASARAEAGLIDSLLEDVGSEPGNLALLEHSLGQLWEKCGGFACTLTNSAYSEMGRLRGALGRHADEIYTGLRDDAQKQLAKMIFLELVHLGDGAQDTRRRVPKADLYSLGNADEIDCLLSHLADNRLISTSGKNQESFVEVSHEALIREWPLLREWLAQNREDLRLERRLLQAAEEWNSLNRDKGALLQGARLAQAEEWLGRHADVPVLLQDFVQSSICMREESRARELADQKAASRRLGWFSAALALMLLAAIAAASFTYRQKVMEKSRAMAAQSGELLQRDHGQALDLAIRSWETARTEEARLAVAKALPETLAILKQDMQGPVLTASYSPNGRLLVTAGSDHHARIWDASGYSLLFELRGHTDKLTYATFSPDSKQVVTASEDHTARVWSTTDGHLLFTLRGHTDKLMRAEFSPDSTRIVTSSYDKTARVWSTRDGRLLLTLLGHTEPVGGVQFSSDGKRILTASWDRTARVWNNADGRLLMTLQNESAVVYAAFSPDNQVIATGPTGGIVKVWSAINGRLLFTLPHDGSISSIEYSRDSQRIVIASLGHSGAEVWSKADGKLLFKLQHDGPVAYAQFSPDGHRIVTAGMDHVARVWNSIDGQLLAILVGHSDGLWDAEFSPDGENIATTSFDGTARIWNFMSGRSTIARGHTSYVKFAVFSPNGAQVLTAGYDKTARIFNAADAHAIATLYGHKDIVNDAEFSPDSLRIVTASDDHTARIWNATNGTPLAILQGHSDSVNCARFSPDGQRILTTSNDNTAAIWSAADGRLLTTLRGHTRGVFSARFSPDGARIVTSSHDNTARIWNTADGRLIATLTRPSGPLFSAAFSPDGQRLVTAGFDHTAQVWNAADGHLLFVFRNHTEGVNFAIFSPDGKEIVTAGQDHTAKLWSAADGRLLITLRGDTDQVRYATFSPDSQYVLTASADKTARIWNRANGHTVAILQGHAYLLSTAQFSPDGKRIVTASMDTTARVWQVLTLDDVCRILGD